VKVNMANIIVIGGGVVGISCALELQSDGCKVTVIDRDPAGEGACWASCGSIAVSEVIPLSKPGTLLRAPKWLIDPTGPLTLRAGSVLSLLPWFLRFAANSRMSRIKSISADISALTLTALADTEHLLAEYKLKNLLRKTPVIEVYDSQKELEHERKFHDLRRALGFQIEEITCGEAVEMEPTIAKDFACATVFHDWRSVVDTKRYVLELHKAFNQNGGQVLRGEVVDFTRDGEKITGVKTKTGDIFSGDQIVVAAGAWSKKLAKAVGLNLLLEGVIGYQTSLETPGVGVTHALVYAKGGFGITPYESGLAIAGSIEFADLSAQPNWKRAEILVEKAKRVLPDLQTTGVQMRIGRRPLTPDTKPIIGRAPRAQNVIFATGHGQLGLTLGATTGRLVRDIIANRPLSIEIGAYRPDRF
jgi:D-amino-acid dehydrogenase